MRKKTIDLQKAHPAVVRSNKKLFNEDLTSIEFDNQKSNDRGNYAPKKNTPRVSQVNSQHDSFEAISSA